MTVPLGPEAPKLPFTPQPPSPNMLPTSPQPVHPEHSAPLGDALGPPYDIGQRQPAVQPPLRPRILGESHASPLADDAEPPKEITKPLAANAQDGIEPSNTPDRDIPNPEIPPDTPHVRPGFAREQTSDNVPVEERAKPTEVAHPVPLTNAVEIKMPAAEQSTEVINPYRQFGTTPLEGKVPGYSPLPPHPGRLEDSAELQAAKDAGQAVTQIILVEHDSPNAPLIAANAHDCGILALEALLDTYTSPEQIEDLERAVTDLLSSDPVKSTAAHNHVYENHSIIREIPFINSLLSSLRETDITVKFVDITEADTGDSALIQASRDATNKWESIHDKHRIPSQETAGAILELAQSTAALNDPRDSNFAGRLDSLRSAYPDQDINLIVGADHYRLGQLLDETHTHALLTGSPLRDADYFDEVRHVIGSGQPLPPSLLERATLEEIYESAAGARGYEKVLPPAELGKGHPDYPTDETQQKTCNYTRKFLLENMTDEQVHDALTRLDKATNFEILLIGPHARDLARERILAELARKHSKH